MHNKFPPLLKHSNQPQPGQAAQKWSSAGAQPEVCRYLDMLNVMRKPMILSMYRELHNENILKRRCRELIQEMQNRENEVLGPKLELNVDSDSNKSETGTDTEEDILSMSEVPD